MINTNNKMYDLIVIGGGSGGVRAARIAALHGAKVALCEKDRMGGTCVIRGCIPKKLLFYSAQFKGLYESASYYGWNVKKPKYNLSKMVQNKNKELVRLEGLYKKNAIKAGVEIFKGEAKFTSKSCIEINNITLKSKNIIIAVGGEPIKLGVKGREFAKDSDSIMQLKKLPRNLVIVGAGYIAIEFAFIFASLGTKVSLVVRKKILRGFDESLVKLIKKNLDDNKVKLYINENIEKVSKKSKGYNVFLKKSKGVIATDEILVAIGRKPNISKLGLDKVKIKCDKNQAIIVNKNLETNIKNIYAIGDVTNRINLTPVAIAEGNALSDKLFGKVKSNIVELKNIGTAVFSSPPICSIGLTEYEAKKKYKKLDVYESEFNSLKYSIVKKKVSTYIKLLVNAHNGLIIGGHMLGDDAPEIIQMVGVAINAKATISNFIKTMAIHPTVSEELVTFKKPSRKYK